LTYNLQYKIAKVRQAF